MCDNRNNVLEQVVGLNKMTGPLSGWCDSYDLLVYTPNGRRETHCLAIEFMCHPSEDSFTRSVCNEKPSPFIIPRLSTSEARRLTLGNLPSVTLLQYICISLWTKCKIILRLLNLQDVIYQSFSLIFLHEL